MSGKIMIEFVFSHIINIRHPRFKPFPHSSSSNRFLPQHFAIGLIHQSYPNATWILNKRRQREKWAQSILHWYSRTWRLFESFSLQLYSERIPDAPAYNAHVTTEEILHDMEIALQQRIYNMTEYQRKLDLLTSVYNNHTSTIRQWSKQFPSHNLIEINVDDDDNEHIIVEILNDVIINIESSETTNTKDISSCKWTYIPPDNEWSDFRFPFS
jgi:hypothetical protein